MPQQIETRLLTGGINTDHAPYAVDKDALLNAVNVRVLRQTTQQGTTVDWIPGNTEVAAVSSLLTGGSGTTLLGKCVDEGTGKLYLLIFDLNLGNQILEYDPTSNSARVAFNDSMVTGGLGWTLGMFIDCEAGDGTLEMADGLHDLRYINTGTTYSSITPISQAQLSLGQEPGAIPLIQSRNFTSGSSTIQYTPLQFSYRVINTDGHTSVLAPYSDTALPARQSAVAISATAGNCVDLGLPLAQLIPANWKRVEFIARFLESNVYYVIKRWDSSVSADVTTINLHNAGTTALQYLAWTGNTLETLDQLSAEKPFDLIPRAPKRLRRAASRLLVGNFIEGYNTPTADPGITVTPANFTATGIASTTYYTPYIIIVNELNTAKWWFAIIIRDVGLAKNYLLPRECATGKFYYQNNQLPLVSGSLTALVVLKEDEGLFDIPSFISREDLIEMKESGDVDFATIGDGSLSSVPGAKDTREKIVIEANDLKGFAANNTGLNWYLMQWDRYAGTVATVGVEATPAEFGPSSKSRAFPSGVAHGIGVQYYDGLGRKSGVQSITQIVAPNYDTTTRSFTEKLTITTPTGVNTAIPDWANSFGITMSRAGNAQQLRMFFGGIVKAMFKNGNGEIVYRDPADLLSPPSGFSIYGIGVPIPKNMPYVYAPGDFVMFSPAGASNRATVIGTINGLIVLQFTNDGFMDALCTGFSKNITIWHDTAAADYGANLTTSASGQQKTAFLLFSGVSNTTDLFEIGTAFGAITGTTGAKQFGNFYNSLSHSATIYGDAHTQIRTSNGGGGTGLSMSTYEVNGQLTWVNDLGRPAPTDSVGQKRLSSAIRYSNTRIPGATVNGYGSFDTNDIKTTDLTAGEITYMALTTRGAQDGGQLIVLCTHGSFAALIGQQQISGADGKNAFTAALGVINDFNALRGGNGCQSPRSVCPFEGRLYYTDWFKRAQIEFTEAGAGEISLFKVKRLFETLLGGVTDASQITAGVDAYTGNMLVSLPATSAALSNLPGFTAEPDISNAVDGSVRTWMYDWTANKWVGGYTSGAEFMRVGTLTFGWKGGKLWKEFDAVNGVRGTYYGGAKDAYIAVPFVDNFPAVKAPLNVRLSALTAPSKTILSAGTGTASIQPYTDKEGVKCACVMRDRTGNGAVTLSDWNAQSVNGRSLKGDTLVLMLRWTGSASIGLRAASLGYGVSSGK